MSTVAIMPCLDLKDGRVVKGVQFVDLVDAGDPVEVARAYAADGARELTLLDITATWEGRESAYATLARVAEAVPQLEITYGGGISSKAAAEAALAAGATRVSIGSAAIRTPDLVSELADAFGSQRIVVAFDVEPSSTVPSGYEVLIDGGRTRTGIDLLDAARDVQRRGAGCLLPTSKQADGAKQGYDTRLITLLKEEIGLSVIASGGAGTMEHFLEAARAGADGLLAASVFHFGEIRITELTDYLRQHGIDVRTADARMGNGTME